MTPITRCFIFFLLLLSACASTPTVHREAASFQNQDVNDLTKEWGTPTSIINLDNGYSEYQYGDQAGYTHRYNPKTRDMQSIPNGCMTVFTAAPDGRIASWRYFGQKCPSHEKTSAPEPY